jgi:hypothetical protein
MNKVFQMPDQWVTPVECYLCKKTTKETYTTSVNGVFFGVEGYNNVIICKECHRESQLNKLL